MRPWIRGLVLLLLFACVAVARAQDVELYEQPRFAGMRVSFSQDAPNLAAYGMAGRVASVVVRRGQWEFCTQPGYGGVCVAVGPGRYAELPPAFRGTLNSVRNAADSMTNAPRGPTQPFPVPGVPGSPGGRPPMPSNEAITLFQDADFSGRQVSLSEANPRLSTLDYNDAALSIEIRRGRWQLCEHADFFGECQVFGRGRHLLAGRLARGVSSLRPVGGADNRPLPAFGGIVLFEHADFQGRELGIADTVVNLAHLGFNDRVSSVEVVAGRWELCSDAEFRGRCIVLGPGRHVIDGGMNDRISSVRPR